MGEEAAGLGRGPDAQQSSRCWETDLGEVRKVFGREHSRETLKRTGEWKSDA